MTRPRDEDGRSEEKGKEEEWIETERKGEADLEEKLDRDRHGSGEYDPAERYGRRDVYPDRKQPEPGDEGE